jgi:ribosomal protein L22
MAEEIDKKIKEEIIEDIEKSGVSEKIAKKEEKIAEKTEKEAEKLEKSEKKEEKKEVKEKKIEKQKKTEAIVDLKSVPISTKQSIAVCRFIKGKKIENAIKELREVLMFKRAVPMKGEIPHRKGKIMSGRYPKKACENFIIILKSLQANANVNGLNDPVIVEAVPNQGSRPYGRYGRVRRKRTHIKIKAMEKKIKEKKK